MARIVRLTVEFHADPELPPELAQQLLDQVVDAVNEIGYVSDVELRLRGLEWLSSRREES